MRTWNNYKADDNTALQDAYERGFRDGYNFMALDEKDSDIFFDNSIWEKGKIVYPDWSDRHGDLINNFMYYFMAYIIKYKSINGDDDNFSLFSTIKKIAKLFNTDMADIENLHKICKLQRIEEYIRNLKRQRGPVNIEAQYLEYVKNYKKELEFFAFTFVQNIVGQSRTIENVTVGDVRKAIAILKKEAGDIQKMRSVMRYCKSVVDKHHIEDFGKPSDKRKFRR